MYNKPAFVLSFNHNIGIGSGRSIENIDLGSIILELKSLNLIKQGGGHRMAVGFKINSNQLETLNKYLVDRFSHFDKNFFEKKLYYDAKISVNQINNEFLNMIEVEPYGKGNEEPQFLIKDIIIENIKVIKNKHIIFLKMI